MLTGTDPTEVIITMSRATLVAGWLGYRLMTTGLSIAALLESTADTGPDEPPQSVKSAASSTQGNGLRSPNLRVIGCVSSDTECKDILQLAVRGERRRRLEMLNSSA